MMDTESVKVETAEAQAESCCICNVVHDELFTHEEYDANAPSAEAPLRSMLLHLNHTKTVPSGRMCMGCITKTVESYNFSTMLASKGPPPLSDKIRALRKRLHELSQKIDVFIVVGGGGARGAYSEQDIILVERDALAAAAQADDAELLRASNTAGDSGYQCGVCPAFYRRAAEYRAHVATHVTPARHSCWACGAQFSAAAALHEHARTHAAVSALHCQLCGNTYPSQAALVQHERSCPAVCPVCSEQCTDRASLRAHAALHDTLCATCLLVLPTSEACVAHAVQHKLQARHVCGYHNCILRFNNRSELLSHIRKCHASAAPHEQEEPQAEPGAVACTHCDRTFGSMAAMKRHARVHRDAQDKEDNTEWQPGNQELVQEDEEYLDLDTLDMDELN